MGNMKRPRCVIRGAVFATLGPDALPISINDDDASGANGANDDANGPPRPQAAPQPTSKPEGRSPKLSSA
jgi:hypothetical protein